MLLFLPWFHLGPFIPPKKMRRTGASPKLHRAAIFLFSCVLVFNLSRSAVDAQPGFISLDCGLPEGENYVVNSTEIGYISDHKYVQGGQPKTVKAEDLARRYQTLRVFPGSEGDRNCYDLQPLQAGGKYLVRAAFFYGNYDGLSSPPEFELYVGAFRSYLPVLLSPNKIDLKEVVTVANGNRIWTCLVNTGKGSPIISAIEVRPLLNLSYPANVSQSLQLQYRFNFGAQFWIRHPFDSYDRMWGAVYLNNLTINTSNPVSTENSFEVPSIVMSTAMTTPNLSAPLRYPIAVGLPTNRVFFVLHFAEIQNITSSNETRIMDIFAGGKQQDELLNYTAPYLQADYVYGSELEIGPSFVYNISILASNSSTLPPILNALESFIELKLEQLPTDLADVGAVEDIKAAYKIVRNWQGDPCVPGDYSWKGLGCSYAVSSAARIVYLNLSSMGINGEIPTSIVNLTALKTLDLSNNQVSIKILDLVAQLPSLETLDLSGIKILGSSQDFCRKALNGTLASKIEGLKAECSPSSAPTTTPSARPTENSDASNKINNFFSVTVVLIMSAALM